MHRVLLLACFCAQCNEPLSLTECRAGEARQCGFHKDVVNTRTKRIYFHMILRSHIVCYLQKAMHQSLLPHPFQYPFLLPTPPPSCFQIVSIMNCSLFVDFASRQKWWTPYRHTPIDIFVINAYSVQRKAAPLLFTWAAVNRTTWSWRNIPMFSWDCHPSLLSARSHDTFVASTILCQLLG